MTFDKRIWIEQFGAAAETLAALPEDVTICRLFLTSEDKMEFQILKHPAVTADNLTERKAHNWAEATAYPVLVGWCEGKEEDDDDL